MKNTEKYAIIGEKNNTKGVACVRYTAAYGQWTAPNRPMAAEFHRMSFALYRTDGEVGRVVATRSPDREILTVGDYIQDRLELSEEAVAFMAGSGGSASLFVLTKTGLGLLCHRYRLSAGLGLYLHIHTHPESAARLINSGALGYGNGSGFQVSGRVEALGNAVTVKDEAAYPALLEAWQAVRDAPKSLFATDTADGLRLSDLRSGMQRLAAFVGCDLTFTVRRTAGAESLSPDTRVKCHRPLMLEGILFCLLAEMREHSATRGGVCRFEPPAERGRDGLAMTLRYPICPTGETADLRFLDAVHSHMTYVGELGGLDVYFRSEPLPPRAEGGLPERVVMLDWLLDPSVLPTSDLKSRLKLLYGEAPRAIPTGDEVPFP